MLNSRKSYTSYPDLIAQGDRDNNCKKKIKYFSARFKISFRCTLYLSFLLRFSSNSYLTGLLFSFKMQARTQDKYQ